MLRALYERGIAPDLLIGRALADSRQFLDAVVVPQAA